MKKKDIVSKLSKLLIKNFPNEIEKVLLFGSRIENKASEFSDYDILVVLKNNYNWKLEDEILAISYEIDLKYNIITDIKLISLDDIHTLRGKQLYIQNALENGIAA